MDKIKILCLIFILSFVLSIHPILSAWSNNIVKPTSPVSISIANQINFQVSWTDLNFSYIEHNFTGTLLNYTSFNVVNDSLAGNSSGGDWQVGDVYLTWDQNWTTMGQVDLTNTALSYENYTIFPNNPINWTVKYDLWTCCSPPASYFYQYCWDYSINDWVEITGNETIHITTSIEVPSGCILQSPFMIKTDLGSDGGNRVGYFEGMVEPKHGNMEYYNYSNPNAGYYQYRYYSNDSVDTWDSTDIFNYVILPTLTPDKIDFSKFNFIKQFGKILHNHNVCSDSQTLAHNITYQITIDQNQSVVNMWVTEPCEFGCDNVTMTCRTSQIGEYSTYGIIIIGIIIALGVIIALYKRV